MAGKKRKPGGGRKGIYGKGIETERLGIRIPKGSKKDIGRNIAEYAVKQGKEWVDGNSKGSE